MPRGRRSPATSRYRGCRGGMSGGTGGVRGVWGHRRGPEGCRGEAQGIGGQRGGTRVGEPGALRGTPEGDPGHRGVSGDTEGGTGRHRHHPGGCQGEAEGPWGHFERQRGTRVVDPGHRRGGQGAPGGGTKDTDVAPGGTCITGGVGGRCPPPTTAAPARCPHACPRTWGRVRRSPRWSVCRRCWMGGVGARGVLVPSPSPGGTQTSGHNLQLPGNEHVKGGGGGAGTPIPPGAPPVSLPLRQEPLSPSWATRQWPPPFSAGSCVGQR